MTGLPGTRATLETFMTGFTEPIWLLCSSANHSLSVVSITHRTITYEPLCYPISTHIMSIFIRSWRNAHTYLYNCVSSAGLVIKGTICMDNISKWDDDDDHVCIEYYRGLIFYACTVIFIYCEVLYALWPHFLRISLQNSRITPPKTISITSSEVSHLTINFSYKILILFMKWQKSTKFVIYTTTLRGSLMILILTKHEDINTESNERCVLFVFTISDKLLSDCWE